MIERTVQDAEWTEDGWTEVTFTDGSTLQGEAVEIVARLRPGQKVELVPGEPYGDNVRMMRMRIKVHTVPEAGQELAPLGWVEGAVPGFPARKGDPPNEVVVGDEVVDGEVVRDGPPDFEWVQWYGDDGATYYKLRVSQRWFQRVPGLDIKTLQAALQVISELAWKTGGDGPRVEPC